VHIGIGPGSRVGVHGSAGPPELSSRVGIFHQHLGQAARPYTPTQVEATIEVEARRQSNYFESGSEKHKFRRCGSGFRTPKILGILKCTWRVVPLKVSSIHRVSQTLIPSAHGANSDLVIRQQDGATGILQKHSVPTFWLHAPRSDKDAASHHDKPDADKSMLGVARTDAQTLRVAEHRQNVIGKP